VYDSGINQDPGFAAAGIDSSVYGPLTPLMSMLMDPTIAPGSDPSYQLCKEIHVNHPIGAVLTDAPITRAQSQERIVKVPGLAESRMIERWWKVWGDIGKEGADIVIHDLMSRSRTYGISSLGVGERGKELSTPLDVNAIAKADLFFNVLDPLNTAGSLVLSLDANSPAYLKPEGDLRVMGVQWHPSRVVVKMNERPLYISWSLPAFGFSGRSVYQRALFLLASYIQTMITDDMVTKKAGLLVAMMESAGSAVDKIMGILFGVKRGMLKSGRTGQVLGIGVTEKIETLNFTNLEAPYKLVRENILKNIASATGMPASIIAQETLTEGFGEGTEDFKKEVQFLNWIRKDMQPAYAFMDRIVMHKAWTPEFFETLKADYPELRKMEFDTWFFQAQQAFTAGWPNLNEEPDSEKSKMEDVQMKSAIALAEVMLPELDPLNKAKVLVWLSENCNEREALFASKLVLDEDELETYLEENQQMAKEAAEAANEPGVGEEEKPPKPFSLAS
jgi:Protein of unknown function (DUF1073)